MGIVKYLGRKFGRGKPGKKSNCMRRLSWDEVRRLTADFSLVIGYGGFSTVYYAQFEDSSAAAVKIYCNTQRLYEAYEKELEILRRIRHDYIVKLLGHCSDREEAGVLILEYTPKGNLQETLHGSKTTLLLPWKQRMAIAFQLAQALYYLHEECSPPIVHGDIKASNILLDQNLNCKLCDFGSAANGQYSSRRMMGSPGYTDPLYLRTGIASKENDVYSFGVVVLEMVTGVEAFSPQSGERLTDKLHAAAAAAGEMVDPRLCLCGDVDFQEATVMLALSARCLITDCPTLRPSASDVLTIMTTSISLLV